ncbi:hypothetical protein ACQKGL_29735 [Ensifer adhaerens]|uniref:hypothetical protein n=1 Tax=Ensifer adhaerens TaxID=106592 RepID=UPI003CFE0B19
MKDWVKLPTAWINAGGLKDFGWKRGEGANHAAALMCLMVIAHHADPDSGESKVTYYTLERATGLSRAKISSGLNVLEVHGIVERRVEKRRSTYKLVGMARSGWGAFPARRMYSASGELVFLRDFSLRKATELNALKLLFLFVARRGTDTNAANISYDKIAEYTGIPREKIRSAVSLLVTHHMVQVDHIPSGANKYGVSNAYRIPFILPHRHMGTSAREAIEIEAADLPF